MRFLLSIGFLVMYGVAFIAETNGNHGSDDEDYVDPIAQSVSRYRYDRTSKNSERERTHEALLRSSIETVTKSMNTFSLKLFKKLAAANTESLFFSPISISLLLSMMYYGANQATKEEIQRVLGFPEDANLAYQGTRILAAKLDEYKAADVNVHNAAFFDRGVSPLRGFQSTMRHAFHCEIRNTYMSAPDIASAAVNEWCRTKTSSRINTIVHPSDFDLYKNFLLVNAVNFRGTWLKQFKRLGTTSQNFYLNEHDTIKVPTMYASNSFRYGSLPTIASTFVELPYEGANGEHNVSMFVILPNEESGLASVIDKLDTINVADLVQQGRLEDMDVYLPKFKIYTKLDLSTLLSGMGMPSLFTARSHENGFRNNVLTIDKFVQSAIIEVDERGNAAKIAPEPPFQLLMGVPIFRANRPFLALIVATGENPLVLLTLRFSGRE